MFFLPQKRSYRDELSALNQEKVVTLAELLFILGCFSLALFLVFPRSSLEEYVLQEKKNLDLTISYLKVLVNKYPLPKYARTLFLAYLQKGDWDKAEELGKSLNIPPLFRYELAKLRYIKAREEGLSEATIYLEKALFLLKEVREKEEVKPSWLYQEYLKLDRPELALALIEESKLLAQDFTWVKRGLDLSLALSKYDKALLFLDKLAELDKKQNAYWQQRKAVLLEQIGRYLESAGIFFELFKNTESPQKQKEFLKSAFLVLERGNKVKEIKIYLQKYLKFLPKDRESLKYFINLARKVEARKEALFLSRYILENKK